MCVYERKCPMEMMITEPGILQMVGQELSTNLLPNSEKTKLIKILVKGKEPRNNTGRADGEGKSTNRTPSGLEAGSNPDIIRLEIMSEYDFFFQYVLE